MTVIKTHEPAPKSGKATRSGPAQAGLAGWTALPVDPAHLDAYRAGLLFALALAAIPGSLVPQRTVSPGPGERLHQRTSHAGPALRPARAVRGLHLALVLRDLPAAVRLPGRLHHPADRCVRPGAPRARPPQTPRNLVRLPAYAAADLPGQTITDGCSTGPPRRCAGGATGSMSPATSVAAERGYLREAGNLVFHISLLFLLVGVAIGALFGFRGTSVVIVGSGLRQQPHPVRRLLGSGASVHASADLVPFSAHRQATST